MSTDNGKSAETPVDPAETPVDPAIVGELSISAMRQIQGLQQQQNQILMEVGQIEHRKSGLLGQLNNIQAQAQALLASEAKRLAIPEGQQWSVGPDGKARVHQVPPPAGG